MDGVDHGLLNVPDLARVTISGQQSGYRLKPVALVRTPGSAHDVIADGHRRALASIDEGRPVGAYVGRVQQDEGSWDEMHSSQLTGNR